MKSRILFFHHCAPLIARYDPSALALARTNRKQKEKLATKTQRRKGVLLKKKICVSLRLRVFVAFFLFFARKMIKIEQAHEYASAKNKNELSAKQWLILKDPDQNLVGGFMKLWQEKRILTTRFIAEAQKITAAAFDTIIRLENGKRR